MVAALKKLTGDDFAGRLAAWWDGREYVAGAEQPEPEKNKAAAPKPVPKKDRTDPVAAKTSSSPSMSAAASRVAALEALWGQGRFSPSGPELYSRLTDNLPGLEGAESRFGVLNTDPSMVTHLVSALGICPVIAEWRGPCQERYREVFPDFDIVGGDLDRPQFEPGTLKFLFSQDAFAFSDHKSGLAVRAYRSLEPGAQWVVMDTVRDNPDCKLDAAFASSWSEPQLVDSCEITEICEAAGFELVRDEDDLTGDILQAYRAASEKFSTELEARLIESLRNANRTAFMHELAWETESWKWRQRALAGELIHVKMWKFRKPEADA